MRVLSVVIMCFALCVPLKVAAQHGVGLTVGTNVGRGDHVPMDFYRLTYHRDWDVKWFSEGDWYVDAHLEMSVIRVLSDVEVIRRHASSTLTGAAVTPMFRFRRTAFDNGLAPFIEAGVGVSIFSDSKIQSQTHWFRDYGGQFQFEDRISFGVLYQEKYRLSIDYMHYSNFDISPPNEGLDLVSATVTFHF